MMTDIKKSELKLTKCTGLFVIRLPIERLDKFNDRINSRHSFGYSFLGDLKRIVTGENIIFQREMIQNGDKCPNGSMLLCMEIKNNDTDDFNEAMNKKCSAGYLAVGDLVEFYVGNRLFFSKRIY